MTNSEHLLAELDESDHDQERLLFRVTTAEAPLAQSPDNQLHIECASVKEKIRKVIKDHARLLIDIATLDDSRDLAEAGMTSHANVMLMLALENEFGLEFPDNMLSRRVFESVDSIASAIATLQSQ